MAHAENLEIPRRRGRRRRDSDADGAGREHAKQRPRHQEMDLGPADVRSCQEPPLASGAAALVLVAVGLDS